MNSKERNVIAIILFIIAMMVGIDIATDSRDGVAMWHIIVEASIALGALLGVFYLLRGSIHLKHRLQQEISEFSAFRKDSELWKAESRKYLDGLSKAIDQQLISWKLTTAEKEVAFLLLKGLSLKEVAQIRQTTEKTARVQSMAIYAKSGVSGRSELSAFFLEDLLVPTDTSNLTDTPNSTGTSTGTNTLTDTATSVRAIILILITFTLGLILKPIAIYANSTESSTQLKQTPQSHIVVSFSILEDLTKQICKDRVIVTSLIDRNGDAHEFEPRAKHILVVKNADLFIYNGLNFEPWIDKFLGQNHLEKTHLNLGAALKLPLQDQNPHIWQDPQLLIIYIDLIKTALTKLQPESKDFLTKNAQTLIDEIQHIHNIYLTKIKKLSQPRWLITPHNGFYHLAKAYGFEYIYLSHSGHNESLSAKTIKQLIDQIKPLKNAFLFEEWGSQSPLLATIQHETQQKNAGFLIGDSLTPKGKGPASTIQAYLKYNNEILLHTFKAIP